MFDVIVSRDVIDHARQQVAGGNFGRRSSGNGTPEQQVTGLIGQTVIHDLFGVPRPQDTGRADRGVDLVLKGLSVDVKTMGRSVRPLPSYSNNFSAAQEAFSTDLLIFCSYCEKAALLTVCGWISKSGFFQRAMLLRAGTERIRGDGTTFRLRTDTYEIETRLLNSPRTFTDLRRQMLSAHKRTHARQYSFAKGIQSPRRTR